VASAVFKTVGCNLLQRQVRFLPLPHYMMESGKKAKCRRFAFLPDAAFFKKNTKAKPQFCTIILMIDNKFTLLL
jgi:hypothetical protein